MYEAVTAAVRDSRLRLCLAAAALVLVTGCAEPRRLNVLMIVSDALRADVIGSYGGSARTPNIDALALRGVLFENAYSTAPSTVPSSVAMFTGRHQHGFPVVQLLKGTRSYRAHWVSDGQLLFIEALRDAGYDTRKSVENVNAGISNNLQGFGELQRFGLVPQQQRAWVTQQLGIRPVLVERERMFGLLSYLLKQGPDRPFFALKWILDPHAPYDPPAGYRLGFGRALADLPMDPAWYSNRKAGLLATRPEGLNERERAYIRALYRAEVEFVDERVGYMLEALRLNSLLDHTLIIFTSDHGEMFGEHGRWGHPGVLYDEAVRVPLIVAGPGVAAGLRVESVVSLLDLVPTLAELLGVDAPDDPAGRSLAAALSGGAIESAAVLLGNKQVHEPRALLDWPHKLTVSGAEQPPTLFDLSTDRGELNDLAAEHSNLVGTLGEVLRAMEVRNARRLAIAAEPAGSRPISGTTFEKLKALGYLD